MVVRRSSEATERRQYVRLAPTHRFLHPDKGIDVAVLEFQDDPELKPDRCSLEQLREDDPPHNADFTPDKVPNTWVVGFPATLILETSTQRQIARTNFGSVPAAIDGDSIEMSFPAHTYGYDLNRNGSGHWFWGRFTAAIRSRATAALFR